MIEPKIKPKSSQWLCLEDKLPDLLFAILEDNAVDPIIIDKVNPTHRGHTPVSENLRNSQAFLEICLFATYS